MKIKRTLSDMVKGARLYHIILFLFTITLFPDNREIRFDRITVEQGLSHSTVYCITQDSEGFIWVGTESGLNRYNGYTFDTFTHIPGDLNSLSSDLIRAICEDSSGTLWIGTREGLNKFDREKETFTCYKHTPDDKNSYRIRTIFEDRAGVIWVGTDSGLHKFDRGKEIFTCYKNNPKETAIRSANIIFSICEDQSGIFWVGTAAGLYKFNRKKRIFILCKKDLVQSIYEDRSGVMWIGTNAGLNRLDRRKGALKLYKIGNGSGVHSIYEDESGVLWIGTGEGLHKFNRYEGIFTIYKYDPRNSYSLSHNFVVSIYEDDAGVMWVGTRVGLNKFNREMKKFKHFRHIPTNANSLSHNHVWSILEDSHGILWIGTDNSLNKYDRGKNRFTNYKHDPENPKSLSHNCVYSIHDDHSGNLWVGTADGLNKFDRERGNFIHYKSEQDNPNSLAGNVISRIFEDRSGFLWVGTIPVGLNKFDPRVEKFTRYRLNPQDPNSISSNAVSAIYEDRSGVLWIGTHGGLNKFNREKEIFTRYKSNPRDPQSLSNEEIESIYEDRSGILWIGTNGGLNRFDRNTGTFTSYTENYGLPHVIYGILEDDQGNLWLSSNRGIFKFNTVTGRLKSYDVRDGLQDYHFNEGAFFKSKSGEMFFGGANGFNAFFPDEIKDNTHIPPVVITSFEVFNRDFKLEKSILQTRVLQLSYNDSFSFEFAALSFSDPPKNRYEYMLKGTRGDWIDLGNKREITFSNLAPGSYTFKVRGSNDDGFWNKEGKELTLIISPPFWQTWWFRLPVLVIIGVIIYSLYRLRVRNIEVRRRHLETQVKERTKELERANRFKGDFLAHMSHEIRTPLNAIIGFNDMLLDTDLTPEQLEYTRTAVRSGESLRTLINDILDFSKVESGQMELEAIDFDPEVTAFNVCELIQPRIVPGSVEVLCRIDDSVPAYIKGDPGRFHQVLLNLMSNAAKFTKKGEIELTLHVEENRENSLTLHTTVKDSGIGIPPDKTEDIFKYFHQVSGSTSRKFGGSGLGLTICKQLSNLMGGDVYVESELGRGSTFHFLAVMEKSGKTVTKGVPPVSLRGKRVLAVDDNEHSLQILSHLLKSAGMAVTKLNRGGTDVLSSLKTAKKNRQPFDICIIDIYMPETSGQEVARIIREKDSLCPKLPLIAFTSSTSGHSRLLNEAGFDGLLAKPVQRKKLFELLERILGEDKLKKEAVIKEMPESRHPGDEKNNRSINILLAEDDPINQKLAKFLLTKAGYQLEVVNNGREALAVYCADPDKYNIILMDVQMPEMDGLEAARAIRKLGFLQIPIIAVTAQAIKGDRRKCLEAGMNDYISKPIKSDVIFAMVKKWVI